MSGRRAGRRTGRQAGRRTGRRADRRFVERVTAWYARAARALPWRDRPAGRRDPYRALVSELMLQQTQVARVAERFDGFLARFPTVTDLAEADEADVLAAWAGLGYYRRARLLHAAAKRIADHHAGVFPDDPDAIRDLPGVGRYTAGAVASMAFGLAEPIVDGNVARVLMRVEGREGAVSDRDTQAWAWDRAAALVSQADTPDPDPGPGPGSGPGVFNEALMELGATICTPRAPRCGECPLATICRAKRAGRQPHIPAPKPRAGKKVLCVGSVLAIDARGRRLVERRGSDGLWAGLWQPPSAERPDKPWNAGELADALGLTPAHPGPIAEFDHQTTHRDVRFRVWLAEKARAGGGREWKSRRAIADLALGTPQRRILLGLGV